MESVLNRVGRRVDPPPIRTVTECIPAEVALPIAGLFRVVSGFAVYHIFLPGWFSALATAATYAGAAYFYLTFDIPSSGRTSTSPTVQTGLVTQSDCSG